jgi:DUF4097 and DUF4098 domain-containing protein YvlB
MKRKWLIVAVLGLLELAICAAILAVTWGGLSWARANGLRVTAFDFDLVSAEADEEQRFAVAGPAALTLDNLAGRVQVVGGAAGEIVVSMHKTAWGGDQTAAEAALADIEVTLLQSGNALTIQVAEPARVVVVGSERGSTVDFVVQVPAETDVSVDSGFGDLDLTGVTGVVDLSTSAGKITVSAVEGEIELRSDFGDVSLERSTAGTVTAASSSGGVVLRQVQASGVVALSSDFGALNFAGGEAASLTAETRSGAVELSDLSVAGLVRAHSDFGRVVLTRVAASGGYDLGSDSGSITVDGASGSLQAETGFGDVSVSNADDVTLQLRTSSGAITFAGTLGDGPHSLETDFGSVRLSLPEDTAATLDLTTGYGSIRSALPITLSGDIAEDHWQGTLNGGGSSLTVQTSSGNISLEALNS